MEGTCNLVVLSPGALLAIFATVPDPRRRQGVRFALSAVLALAAAAILSNHLSVLAIAEWGATQRVGLLRALGFPNGVTHTNQPFNAYSASSTRTIFPRP